MQDEARDGDVERGFDHIEVLGVHPSNRRVGRAPPPYLVAEYGDHLLGQVDAQDLTSGRHPRRGGEQRRPLTTADVEHPFSGVDVGRVHQALTDRAKNGRTVS